MARQWLRSSWVLPIAAPPIADGVIAIEGDRIAWVGPASKAESGADVHDLGDAIVMPGTVNAHCHLELSHLAGRLPRQSGFVAWVEALVQQRLETPRDEVRARTSEAIRSVEACGAAAVGDVSNALDHLDLLARSRLHAVVFYELLAWDPARSDEVARASAARLAEATATLNGRMRIRLAAHSP